MQVLFDKDKAWVMETWSGAIPSSLGSLKIERSTRESLSCSRGEQNWWRPRMCYQGRISFLLFFLVFL